MTCLAIVVSTANIPGVTIPGDGEYRHMLKSVASIEQGSPAEEERNLVVNIYGTDSGEFGPYVATGNEYEPTKNEPVASGYWGRRVGSIMG